MKGMKKVEDASASFFGEGAYILLVKKSVSVDTGYPEDSPHHEIYWETYITDNREKWEAAITELSMETNAYYKKEFLAFAGARQAVIKKTITVSVS